MTMHRFDFAVDGDRVFPFPAQPPAGRLVPIRSGVIAAPKGWGGLRRLRDRWSVRARGGLLFGLAVFLFAAVVAFSSLMTMLIIGMLAVRPPQ